MQADVADSIPFDTTFLCSALGGVLEDDERTCIQDFPVGFRLEPVFVNDVVVEGFQGEEEVCQPDEVDVAEGVSIDGPKDRRVLEELWERRASRPLSERGPQATLELL